MTHSLNTIYIISKGRPQCQTAQRLLKIQYPGEWFIVCGTNDETIPEYQQLWGEEKVLIFDWEEEVKHSDLLDNFGIEDKASGAVPVRNATRRLSFERGETRHWQFDDDYKSFYHLDKELQKWKQLSGIDFQRQLQMLADYAYNADLSNVGFAVDPVYPQNAKGFTSRVFNAHNLPSDPDKFIEWKGRLNDDLINALTCYHLGKKEMSFYFMKMINSDTQKEAGGLTEVYEQEGTVRKTAYAVLTEPQHTKLVIARGRYHHKVNWKALTPKVVNSKYAK